MSVFKAPKFSDILEAKKTLSEFLPATPLLYSDWLSVEYGCKVYLKLETAQPIGSFKIRGASYRISKLLPSERELGVIAASAGNHSQGVAWAARRFGTKALIVMPETAPLTKMQNTQALGAEVHVEGQNYDESYTAAKRIAESTGMVYVHAFHSLEIIAGQATVATEILDQLPDVDAIVTSIGGGGLASGIGIVLEELRPSCQLIACQASATPAMVRSIEADTLVTPPTQVTFADGIQVKSAHPDMLNILKRVVTHTCEVDDEATAMGVLKLLEKAKVLAEGSGGIVIGALEKFREELRGKKVVLVVSGGNIDINLVSRIIDRGLTKSGRRLRVDVLISDRPGCLAKLTQRLADLRVNILQTIHDRDEPMVRIDQTEVHLTLETRGPEHAADVIRTLTKEFDGVRVIG
jgi:threonine dehydratase